MRVVAAGVAVAWVLGVSPALAQPGRTPVQQPYQYQPAPAPAPAESATRTHRYGTKIALVDALSFGAVMVGAIMFASAVDSDSPDQGDAGLGAALVIGGLGAYVFGGPLLHLSEGNKSGAWKSFGLRVGLPVLGAVIGEAIREQECGVDYCTESSGPGDELAGLGVLTAMVVDWIVLAKIERPAYPYAPYATANGDGGATVGLVGAF